MDESAGDITPMRPVDERQVRPRPRTARWGVTAGIVLTVVGVVALLLMGARMAVVWFACTDQPDYPPCSGFAHWWAVPGGVLILGGVLTIAIALIGRYRNTVRTAVLACCVAATLVAAALTLIKALSYLP